MNKKIQQLLVLATASSVVLAVSIGFANPISNAKQCLNQAARIANANIAGLSTIVADAVTPRALKFSQNNLNGWDGTSLDAKGIYHSSIGWSREEKGKYKFYNVVYMGKACGVLSTSRLACRLQLGSGDLTSQTNLDGKLKQTLGMECTVCRGARYDSSSRYDVYGVPGAMRASALRSDLNIARNFSVGAVKIVGFEDAESGACPSTPDLNGADLYSYYEPAR